MAFPPMDTVKQSSVDTSLAKKKAPFPPTPPSGAGQLQSAMAAHAKANPKKKPPPFAKRPQRGLE